MNAVRVSEDNEAKKAELAAIIKSIEENVETCRISLHFKSGRLVSGDKFVGIMK